MRKDLSKRWFFGLAIVALHIACAVGRQLHAQTDPAVASKYHNPVLWEDLADDDVLRVGHTYYDSASTMQYSPGAPILRSYDLVHWEYIGHSVPRLDFGPQYDMNGGTAYVRGVWASFLGYREKNRTFYWGGCIDFKKTYIYTATDPAGDWQHHATLDQCYYDAGLLVDRDDTLYVAHGNTKISVAQLSADATHEVKSQVVFESPKEIGALEGSRFYRIHGDYYIFTPHPPNGEYVLRSTTGPFGPYTARKLVLNATSPIAGGGAPHQGGIVQTPLGEWYYMAFTDAYPGGRVPVLAPISWGSDGWPTVQLTGNAWASEYPFPDAHSSAAMAARGDFHDDFNSPALGPEWEWNHNPDNAMWSTGHGLTLKTASIADDIYHARDTLTHRIPGPVSTATVALDATEMQNGDFAGLALLRDVSAMLGIRKDERKYRISLVSGECLQNGWKVVDKGQEEQTLPLNAGKVWFRVTADIHPGSGRTASFSYSVDGKTFHAIGKPFVLNADWRFFMGYRFALFNYAQKALGGTVRVESFEIQSAK